MTELISKEKLLTVKVKQEDKNDEEKQERKQEENQKEKQNISVRFLVGPEKTEFIVDKVKIITFVHLIDDFKDEDFKVDIPVDSFQVFVNMVHEKSYKIASTTMAFSLLALAKKMFSFPLNNICIEYLKANYECDQAFEIYEYAKTKGLTKLSKRCIWYIASNFKSHVASEAFLTFSIGLIEELCSSDNLNVTELELVKALITYAKHHHRKYIRTYMRPAVDKIRFEELEALQLLQVEDMKQLLSADELLDKLKLVVERCTNRPQGNRDSCRSIAIYYDFEDNAELKSKSIVVLCKFSEDLFLDSMELNEEFADNLKSVMINVGGFQKVVKMTESRRIIIERDVKANVRIEMIVQLESCQKTKMGIPSTEAPDVVLFPDLLMLSVPIITKVKIRRIEKSSELLMTWKCFQRTS